MTYIDNLYLTCDPGDGIARRTEFRVGVETGQLEYFLPEADRWVSAVCLANG